jgi:hypothetical protein
MAEQHLWTARREASPKRCWRDERDVASCDMTEASSGQPNTPEQQSVQANPDEPTTPEQNQTDSSQNEPSSAAQEPAKSGPRRSNEFWLALAGIAATLIVGTTGSWLAYTASSHQVNAESARTALNFSRQQKENAYAAFLDAVATLDRQELEFAALSPFDIKQAEDQFKLVDDAYLKFNRASSTVRLVASPDVEEARKKIRDKHNDIQGRIREVMKVGRSGEPGKATGPAADLYKNLDLAPSPLLPNFIADAQRDLGFSGD